MTRAALLVLAGLVYQVFLGVSRGQYHRELLLASLVLFALVAGAIAAKSGGPASRASALASATAALLIVQGWLLFRWPVTFTLSEFPASLRTAIGAQSVVVGLILATAVWATRSPRTRPILLAVIAASNLALSVAIIRYAPVPNIDVLVFHRDGTAALTRGDNPYAISFPNVYATTGDNSRFYSPEVQRDGQVMFGYPYPPLALLVVVPSQLLLHDARYGLAACYSAAVLLIGATGGGVVSLAAAAVLAASPACWVLILHGWTEPELLLALAAIGFSAAHRSGWLPVFLGLFFALKQYTVIYVPLLFQLVPRPLVLASSVRWVGRLAAASLAVSLPLVLWNIPAFWHSAVEIHAMQPFRTDAFSFIAMWGRKFPAARAPASLLAFPLLVPLYAAWLWKVTPGAEEFLLGVGAATMVFLAVNQQAFLNYHAFAAGALLIAAASSARTFELRLTDSDVVAVHVAEPALISRGEPVTR